MRSFEVNSVSDDRLLNCKQAAAYLGKSTIFALVSQGELICLQFGAGKTKKGITRFHGKRTVRLEVPEPTQAQCPRCRLSFTTGLR